MIVNYLSLLIRYKLDTLVKLDQLVKSNPFDIFSFAMKQQGKHTMVEKLISGE